MDVGRKVLVLAALTLLAAAGCSTSTSNVEPHTLRGTLTLNPDAIGAWAEGAPCGGGGGYSDLQGGAAAVVRDANSATVAQTELEPGELQMSMVSDSELSIGVEPEPLACRLSFSVEVPATSDFYEVSIGSRDPVPLTADEMDQELLLSIG